MILRGLGTNFHYPEEWLEIWCLFSVNLVSSQILRPSLGDGKLVHPWALVTTIPGSVGTDSEDLETETGSLETELRVHGIHDTPWEQRLQIILRSLVATLKEGSAQMYTLHRDGVKLAVLWCSSRDGLEALDPRAQNWKWLLIVVPGSSHITCA